MNLPFVIGPIAFNLKEQNLRLDVPEPITCETLDFLLYK